MQRCDAGAVEGVRDTAASSIAQQWEITRLLSSFEVWREHLRAQISRDHPRLDLNSPGGASILNIVAPLVCPL